MAEHAAVSEFDATEVVSCVRAAWVCELGRASRGTGFAAAPAWLRRGRGLGRLRRGGGLTGRHGAAGPLPARGPDVPGLANVP